MSPHLHHTFFIVTGPTIASGAEIFSSGCKKLFITKPTKFSFGYGIAEFDLFPTLLDSSKNIYEFQIKNEKGSFIIMELTGKIYIYICN